jgi:hypothetical protein
VSKRRKNDAERRDLMRVGLRVPLEEMDTDDVLRPTPCSRYERCPHCYQSKCACRGTYLLRNSSRYSAADYMPYAMTEDDMIACIDLLNLAAKLDQK